MDKTIEMAREAGFNVKMFKPPVITAQHSNGSWVSVGDELKAFEALVRADEREQIEDLLKEYDMVNSAFGKDFRARGNHD